MPSQFSYPLTIIGLGVAGLVCAACTQPRMVVPADVGQGMDELVVEGRSQASGLFVNEDFKITPYQVANVSRGMKHGSKFGAFGGFKSSAETGYSFDFKSGDKTTHGECISETSESG